MPFVRHLTLLASILAGTLLREAPSFPLPNITPSLSTPSYTPPCRHCLPPPFPPSLSSPSKLPASVSCPLLPAPLPDALVPAAPAGGVGISVGDLSKSGRLGRATACFSWPTWACTMGCCFRGHGRLRLCSRLPHYDPGLVSGTKRDLMFLSPLFRGGPGFPMDIYAVPICHYPKPQTKRIEYPCNWSLFSDPAHLNLGSNLVVRGRRHVRGQRHVTCRGAQPR